MAMYSASSSNEAMVAGEDILTLIPAASRKIELVEVSVSGMGTASAANEVQVARSTGGATPVAATIEPLDPDAPAAASAANNDWTTHPTLGDVVLRLGVNANGGIYRWVARPGEEIIERNSGQLSIRQSVGTSNMTVHIVWNEV